jgi:hypothetical protein
MNNEPSGMRSWLEAAIYYFKGDGQKFLLIALRPIAGILVTLGILDDLAIFGVADDVLTLPVLGWIVFQIWRRRNPRRFP